MSVFKKGGDFNYMKFVDCLILYGDKYLQHLWLAETYRYHRKLYTKHMLYAEQYKICFINRYQQALANHKMLKNKPSSIYIPVSPCDMTAREKAKKKRDGGDIFREIVITAKERQANLLKLEQFAAKHNMNLEAWPGSNVIKQKWENISKGKNK